MGKAACRFVIEEALASDILAIYEIGRICFFDAWRKETVDHDFQERTAITSLQGLRKKS